MSLLYKKEDEVTIKVDITDASKLNAGKPLLKFDFYSDCGKHGADESLASFEFTPADLIKMFTQFEP